MANMKELFPEFYLDSLEVNDLKEEQNNLIVFDSNFLLDILRLPTEIAEKYLEAIEKVKNHIFIPYLVGLEFNFNKKKVKIETLENVKVYKENVARTLDENTQKIYSDLCELLLDDKYLNFLNNKTQKEDIQTKTKEKLELFNKKILEEKNDVISKLHEAIEEKYSSDLDQLTARIIDLIGDSVASKLTQEWLDMVQEKGNERYSQEIPPGFNDRKEKEGKKRTYSDLSYDTQYGDYIIWEEILHKVASEGSDVGKKVIFVTSDGNSEKKYDIMYRVKGKTVGPYVSMVNELYELKKDYSLDNCSSTEESLNKTLHICDGFRFMTLANDLDDSQARLYEPEQSVEKPILNLNKNLTMGNESQGLIYPKTINRRPELLRKRNYIRSKIKYLEEQQIDASLEISMELEDSINDLQRELEYLNMKLHRGEGSRGIFNTIETDFETTDYNSGLDNSFSNLHSRLIREELVVKRKRIIQEISRLRALSAEIEDDEERYGLEVHISNLLREKRLLDRKISNLDHSSGGN